MVVFIINTKPAELIMISSGTILQLHGTGEGGHYFPAGGGYNGKGGYGIACGVVAYGRARIPYALQVVAAGHRLRRLPGGIPYAGH